MTERVTIIALCTLLAVGIVGVAVEITHDYWERELIELHLAEWRIDAVSGVREFVILTPEEICTRIEDTPS